MGLIAVTAVLSVAANWVAYDIGRDSLIRMLAYQLPYALLQAVAALQVWRSRRRKPMDIALVALFSFSVVQFATKPLVAQWTGGMGDFAQSYIATAYALYSQSIGAILQVAVGLLMLMLLVRDMLVEVTARSETDPLSGLLNRRGFEDRAVTALAGAAQGRTPVALVVADLDSFKSINDGFGHETGDQVIIAFAGLLAAAAPPKAIVSRMGGEEFAVLLPGANLTAAGLYAEALRAAYGGTPIAALPAHMRVTASFGVAQFDDSESLSDLRRRADVALYASKRGGRDRVSVAAEADADAMPAHPLAGTSVLRQAG